jgi:CBS domain-containing protein
MEERRGTVMTLAQDLMTANPVVCKENDTIFQAVEIMQRQNTGVVPIVEQNQACCGIITDRDICLQVVIDNLDPKSTPISQIMTRDLLTCKPDEPLENILHQMERKQVKRMLVVDDNNRIAGIISEADIARAEGRDKVGELAEGVYR